MSICLSGNISLSLSLKVLIRIYQYIYLSIRLHNYFFFLKTVRKKVPSFLLSLHASRLPYRSISCLLYCSFLSLSLISMHLRVCLHLSVRQPIYFLPVHDVRTRSELENTAQTNTCTVIPRVLAHRVCLTVFFRFTFRVMCVRAPAECIPAHGNISRLKSY